MNKRVGIILVVVAVAWVGCSEPVDPVPEEPSTPIVDLDQAGQRTVNPGAESLRIAEPTEHLLGSLVEALAALESHDAQAAELVKLRYFAGIPHYQAAELMGISRRTADRLWTLGRTWLYRQMSEG